MKTFDETYTDSDFEREIADARSGWMDKMPRSTAPDLSVEGLNRTLLARLLGVLIGPRR